MDEKNLSDDPSQFSEDPQEPTSKGMSKMKLSIIVVLIILVGVAAYMLAAGRLFQGFTLIDVTNQDPITYLTSKDIEIEDEITEGFETDTEYKLTNIGENVVHIWLDKDIEGEFEVFEDATCKAAQSTPDPDPICGDGEVNQANEDCDGGINCDDNCKLIQENDPAICGDGVVNQDSEECDGGKECDSNCKIIPICGDGEVNQDSEQCDDPNNPQLCNSQCRNAYCGDFELRPGVEECDAGPDGSNICTSDCRLFLDGPIGPFDDPFNPIDPMQFGDGVYDPAEQIFGDDGFTDPAEMFNDESGFDQTPAEDVYVDDDIYSEDILTDGFDTTFDTTQIDGQTGGVADQFGEDIYDSFSDDVIDSFEKGGFETMNPNDLYGQNNVIKALSKEDMTASFDGNPNAAIVLKPCEYAIFDVGSIPGVNAVNFRVNDQKSPYQTEIDILAPPTVCGNGKKEIGEFCDDGGDNGKVGSCNKECTEIIQQESSTCGNGKVEAGEKCDHGLRNGQPGYCDSKCTDVLPQTTSTCGDGKVEGDEVCDDALRNGQPGYCNSTCSGELPPGLPGGQFDPICGDGKVEGDEVCDDGGQNGQLGQCNNTCDAILPNSTGGGSSSVPECADGKDNDGDGWYDLDDPGCDSALDDDETHQAATNIPECADGIDNDGDGKIDGKDGGCVNAFDDDETNEPEKITKKATAKEVVKKYEAAGLSCLDKVKYIKYNDIEESSYSEAIVDTIYLLSQLANENKAIVIGYDDPEESGRLFGPDLNIRRDEAVKIAYVGTCFETFLEDANNLDVSDAGYGDISSSDWSDDIVNALSNAGIISGYSDGNFYPGQNVTRAEFIKILVDIYLLQNTDAEFSTFDPDEHPFLGIDENDWHRDYMATAYDLGIIEGYKYQDKVVLNPDIDITRSEAAVLMNNYLANTLEFEAN